MCANGLRQHKPFQMQFQPLFLTFFFIFPVHRPEHIHRHILRVPSASLHRRLLLGAAAADSTDPTGRTTLTVVSVYSAFLAVGWLTLASAHYHLVVVYHSVRRRCVPLRKQIGCVRKYSTERTGQCKVISECAPGAPNCEL